MKITKEEYQEEIRLWAESGGSWPLIAWLTERYGKADSEKFLEAETSEE